MWKRLWATPEAVYVDPKNTLSIQGLPQHIRGTGFPVGADSGLNRGLTTDWLYTSGPDNLPKLWFLPLYNGHGTTS